MITWARITVFCVVFCWLISCAGDSTDSGTTGGIETDAPEVIEEKKDTKPAPEKDIESHDTPTQEEELPTPSDAHLGDGQKAPLNPPPPEPNPRNLKRVNLDQLQAAILTTTGMKGWVSNPKNIIEKNATSLGRPDYETSIMENLEPGLLFEKLLGDSAREICPLLMENEKSAPKDERIFIKHVSLEDTLSTAPDLIEKNMRMLLLRFHGNYLSSGSKRLEPWLTLFETATNDTETPEPVSGWSVICTTLLVHPDFISY